jgi:two-component system, NtrC family, response regulator AtoC
VQQILAKIRDEMQIHEIPVIGPAVIDAMRRYSWPGNVRELRNVLERALILSHGKEINLSVLGTSDSERLLP